MGKRGNGEGSVYQESERCWRASVTIDGRRYRFSAASESEAWRVLASAREEAARGGGAGPKRAAVKVAKDVPEPPAGSMTLGQWLERWLEDVKLSIKPETYRKYAGYVKHHLTPILGDVALTELTPRHVRQLHREMGRAKVSSTTIVHAHSILGRALQVAMGEELVGRNVARIVDKPMRSTLEQKWLTPDEVRKLVTAVEGKPYEARVLIALMGLRQGEALGLRWCDIDFETGTLRVRHSLTRSPEGLRLVEPKTQRSGRTMMLPAAACAALQRLRAEQAADHFSRGVSEEEFVFCSRDGGPCQPGADWRTWGKALSESGVRYVRLHDARHSFATLLLVEGVDSKIVADALGHSSLQMVHQRYGHVADEMRTQVRDAASRGLFGSAGA